MGGGSLGFGKSKQSSQQTQQSYGYNGSNAEQFSQGVSQSTSGGQATSTQGLAFEDLFQQLYGNASNTAQGLSAQSGELTDAARMLFSGGQNFLQQLGGGADTQYLTDRLQGNPQLDEQIQGLSSDIGQFYREQINPNITSSAVSGGTLGGGRQGVAQGMAAEAAGKQFQRGVVDLRSQDLAARDAAAKGLADSRISAATGGLSSLPGMFGVAQGGFGAALAPYQALASIMGGPTTLTQSESSQFSQATAEDIARAISSSFGEDFSKAQGTSKGSATNFSMSGYYGIGGGK